MALRLLSLDLMARFLVVDDDHVTVSGMTRLLEDDGHEVRPATSGADALEALSRHSFDAVVTDLEMPHVDGHAVVRATREHHPHACLVVVTARASEHAARLSDAGACFITDKPCDYDVITKTLAECRERGMQSGAHRCHLRSRAHEHGGVKLRRK